MARSESGFVAIGEGILFKTGQMSAAQTILNDHPTLILIFGWMGAKLPHLYKYSAQYDALYPQAAQLIVQCELSFFLRRQTTTQLALEPVLDVLEALGCIHPPNVKQPDAKESVNLLPRILVHSFSNGGTSQLTTLGKLLSSKSFISPPLTTALIIDSAPGTSDLPRAKKAFTAHIRSPPLRFMASFIITFIYGILQILLFCGLMLDASTVLKHALLNDNDSEDDKAWLCMPPFLTTATPRLYIYSKTDALVPFKDVQANIRAAKEKGMVVKEVVLEKSEHVTHARTEPERYWTAVRKIWEQGVRCSEMK